MKHIVSASIVFFFFLFITPSVLSATITLSNGSSQISDTDEYAVTVHVSINATDGKQYFLRGVFHQPGASNYCGYTWNGNNWYNGPIGNGENFLPITITQNVWDGQLKAKIDTQDSGCSTSGTYNFKILRYIGSSSTGNDETVTEESVIVTIPTPTPTLTPIPTAFPTSTPIPTATPTIKPSATSRPLPSATPSHFTPSLPSAPPTSSFPPSPTLSEILSASITAQVSSSPTPTIPTKVEGESASPNALFFILGGIMLGISGITGFIVYKRKDKTKRNESSNSNNE